MTRLLIGLAVAYVVLTVYALADAAFFERSRIRGLPRYAWLLIVLFVPVVGAALWFTVGRGRRGSTAVKRRTVAPDDDMEFLGRLGRDTEQEQRIRKLEQELADLDGGAGRPAPGAAPPAPGSAAADTADAAAAAQDDDAATDASADTGSATPGQSDETGDAPGASGSRDA